MERNGVARSMRDAMVGAGGRERIRERALSSLFFLQISKRYIQISDLANKVYNYCTYYTCSISFVKILFFIFKYLL